MTRTATRREVAHRGLVRVVPFHRDAAEQDEADDGLTLDGHAAVFNQLTLIDLWEGRFYKQCAPGCFARTFRRLTPVLQFDHGRHPTLGSIPSAARVGRSPSFRATAATSNGT